MQIEVSEKDAEEVITGRVMLSEKLSLEDLFVTALSLPQSPSQSLKEAEMKSFETALSSSSSSSSPPTHRGTLRFSAKAVPAPVSDAIDAEEDKREGSSPQKTPARRKRLLHLRGLHIVVERADAAKRLFKEPISVTGKLQDKTFSASTQRCAQAPYDDSSSSSQELCMRQLRERGRRGKGPRGPPLEPGQRLLRRGSGLDPLGPHGKPLPLCLRRVR